MNQHSETAFLHKAHTAFVDSLDRLDARVLARLREGRARAVAAVERHPPWRRTRSWTLPAGAAAAALVAVACAILWWNQNSQPAVPFAADNNTEDMAIVLGNDNLDMYADMDFYRWLQAQQPQNAPQGDSGGHSSG